MRAVLMGGGVDRGMWIIGHDHKSADTIAGD